MTWWILLLIPALALGLFLVMHVTMLLGSDVLRKLRKIQPRDVE